MGGKATKIAARYVCFTTTLKTRKQVFATHRKKLISNTVYTKNGINAYITHDGENS